MCKWLILILTGLVFLVVLCLIILNIPKSQEAKLVEEAKSELFKIIDSNDTETVRIAELKKLAKKVGAGTEHTENESPIPRDKGFSIRSRPISESELVQNIQQALQTLTMIDMCKVATKNYRIAIVSTLAAVISALGAWTAVKKKQKLDLDEE
jgi:hypothetical protein